MGDLWDRRLVLKSMAATAISSDSWASAVAGSLENVPTRNTFLSQNPGLPGWGYAFGKIVDDYSGGVYNPHWGALGAMVFHGGGHAATFDNSVVVLDLNDLTFKRLSRPSTDLALDATHCEYGDGQPGAGHTYDTLAILPPSDGGAACGSLIRVSSHAVHVNASCNTGWSHRFDFVSTAMRDGRWTRWSVNGLSSYLAPGACSAYDTRRKRFWWMAALSSAPPMVRYLDVASRTHLDVLYSPKAHVAPPANPDSTTLRYDPLRDQLVLSCTSGTKAVLAYLSCATPEAGWFVARLSADIAVGPQAALPFDWVPESDKLVLLSPADPAAVYDIALPPAPTQTWRVTRRPLGGQLIPTAMVVGKRWSYAGPVKAFVWMAHSTSSVVAYRPAGDVISLATRVDG